MSVRLAKSFRSVETQTRMMKPSKSSSAVPSTSNVPSAIFGLRNQMAVITCDAGAVKSFATHAVACIDNVIAVSFTFQIKNL